MSLFKKDDGTKKVLIYANKPVNYVVVKLLHERLMRDPRIEVFLSGKLDGECNPEAFYSLFGLEEEKTLTNPQARRKPFDLYLCGSFKLVGRKARQKALVFHGVSLKNRAISEHARKFDKLLLAGSYMKRRFVEAGIFKSDDPRLEAVGMPKVDRLVDGSLSPQRIKEELGLEPSWPCLLYAPTWSERSSLSIMGEEVVKLLCQQRVNLMVKLHDISLDKSRNAIDWPSRLKAWEAQGAKVIRDYDIVPYLFISDLLITDASSVATEFCLLDRPIVWLDVPELFAQYPLADMDFRKTGPVVKGPHELLPVIEKSLSEPQSFSPVRQKVAQEVFHLPGSATERAMRILYQLLELDEHEAP